MESAKNSFSLVGFIKKNAVMCIALLAAVITCFFVPPDKEYFGYFDYKTLTCLFCVLAVVCALKNISFFYILARKVVQLFKTARISIINLNLTSVRVMITFSLIRINRFLSHILQAVVRFSTIFPIA